MKNDPNNFDEPRLAPLAASLVVQFVLLAYSEEVLVAIMGRFPTLSEYLITDASLLLVAAVLARLAAKATPLGRLRWVCFSVGILIGFGINTAAVLLPEQIRDGTVFGICAAIGYTVSLAITGAASVGSRRLSGIRVLSHY